MKAILKNFFSVLKIFKTASILNILGLSAALTVFLIVVIQVHFDLSFDRGYKNYDNITQFNIYQGEKEEASTHINFQIPALIKERIPEIKQYCMVANWGANDFDIDKGSSTQKTYKVNYVRATSGFWETFSPTLVSGDTTSIFSSPGKAMISEKTAVQLFGDESPIGKEIDFHYGNSPMTITAVYKDFPKNSSMGNGLYTYLPEYDDTEWSFNAYFLINPKDLNPANDKINSSEIIGDEIIQSMEEDPEIIFQYRLSSLNDLYLYNIVLGGSKRINTIISLLVIGVLTLLIAYINSLNLSLAMIPSRVRSINIRKILGINKLSLKIIIAMESVIFTFISLFIAFLIIYFIKSTSFAQDFFSSDLSFSVNKTLFITSSIFVLLFSFLIGLYISYYSTKFDESEALKGSFAQSIKGTRLRNILIVIQFTTAICLICVSSFIKRQHNFMLSYDWGMPKENIVYLPLAGIQNNAESFGQELLRDPRITDYCITRALPGRVGMSWGREFEGKGINLYVWSVDDRFFDFFDVDIIAGRKPDHMDSVVSQIIVNETFLKKYEFDESIIGKDFPAFGPGRIQAIAKDINFHSLHEPITPMAFGVLSRWQNFNYFLVKLSGNDIKGGLKYIENTWNKFSNEQFEVNFLDENMNRLYINENNMAKLIAIFGFIIVVIAIMGVYGLVLFNTKYKTKEIAIRKANGASIKDIILMLNKTVLIHLIIAFIIAVPIAYFITYKWLENFAYKISISWWVFLLGGLIVFAVTIATVSIRSYKAAAVNPVNSLNKD